MVTHAWALTKAHSGRITVTVKFQAGAFVLAACWRGGLVDEFLTLDPP